MIIRKLYPSQFLSDLATLVFSVILFNTKKGVYRCNGIEILCNIKKYYMSAIPFSLSQIFHFLLFEFFNNFLLSG
jgi:hypothetical protein